MVKMLQACLAPPSARQVGRCGRPTAVQKVAYTVYTIPLQNQCNNVTRPMMTTLCGPHVCAHSQEVTIFAAQFAWSTRVVPLTKAYSEQVQISTVSTQEH